jgi:hypothetical protein
MRRICALLILALASVSAAEAQNAAARHPLDGVWSRVAGVTGGEVVTTQPGYRMFVDGHWSTVRAEGLVARPNLPASGATADQVRAAYQRFTASAGRLEPASVQTYLQRNEVAINPAGMAAGQYGIQLYRVRGDTLWTSNIMNQAGPIPDPQTGKYVRVRNGGASPIDGAWRFVESRNPGGTVINSQPGLRLMVDGHFSLVRVNGTAPRPMIPGATATAEQLLAALGPFTAQHGTFEISGETMKQRFLVTKEPGGMTDPVRFTDAAFRIRGDSLWVTNTANQAGPLTNQATHKYVRVRATRPPTE